MNRKLIRRQGWLLSFIICSFTNLGFAQAPAWSWAQHAGGSGFDEAYSIVVDASGNSYMTGYFSSSSISFGSTTLSNAGYNDIFLVKYDPAGNVLWAKNAGGTGDDRGYDLAVDALGNCYLTAFFGSSSLTMGSSVLTNAGFLDVLVAKYDPLGNVVWAKSIGASGAETAGNIALDGSGNIYVRGVFQSSTLVVGSATLTNAGGDDIFLVKYDALGNVLWATSAGGPGGDYGGNIAADGSGNIFMIGYFGSSSLSFGSTVLTNAGGQDVFVAKYDPAGNPLWAERVGGAGDEQGFGLSVDAGGDSYIAGSFTSQNIILGTTTLTNASAGTFDAFVAKLDPAGTPVWANRAGGGDDESFNAIAIDGLGNSYVAGGFISSSVTIGATTLNSSGGGDVLVAEYDPSGNPVWAKHAGSSSFDAGQDIALDPAGNCYVAGLYLGNNMSFGATTFGNSGGTDLFVAKLGAAPLAVKLSAFTARNEGPVNKLAWTTQEEQPGDYFTLEKSTDSKDFADLAVIRGKGASSYSFTDALLSPGTSYYRLKITNAAGASSYTGVITATQTPHTVSGVTAFPNPFTCVLHVDAKGLQAIGPVTIYDQMGRQVISENKDEAQIDINTRQLAPGVYWLNTAAGGKWIVKE